MAVRSLAWLKSGPSEDEVKIVEYWHGILKEMVDIWEKAQKQVALVCYFA